MATPSHSKSSGGNSKKGSQQPLPPSKNAEKHFGSEVDLKIHGVINPPQKLTQDEKLPDPPEIPDRKPSKDATQQESLKELAEKLQSLGTKTEYFMLKRDFANFLFYIRKANERLNLSHLRSNHFFQVYNLHT